MNTPTAPTVAKLFLLACATVVAGSPPCLGVSTAPLKSYPMLLRSEGSLRSMEAGRDLLLRFRLNESERMFKELAQEPDGRPAAFYFLTYSSALKSIISDEADDHREFQARADSLSAVLVREPDTPWRSFFAAESNLLRSIVLSKRGKYLRAALEGRKAYREYERLLARTPGFHEAQKGLGLLHIAVGSLPGFYRTFLSVLGMHGSVDQGIRELRVAADSSSYAREEADIILSLFDILVDVDSDAGTRLSSLLDRHPDSPLFGHLYGFYLYSERRAFGALEAFEHASEHARRPEYFDLHFIDFYLGDTLFRLGRYADAVPYYQRYLDLQSGPALKAIASLGMGRSLEMIGQRHAAESFYEHVRAAREFDSDRAARRLAERLLDAPMTEVQRSLLEGQNAFDSSRYEDANRVLEGVLADERSTTEQRAEALYRLARCDHVRGRLPEALERYRAATETAGVDEGSRWAPWSAYYVGRIQEAAGKNAAALNSYERALSYSDDYDYRQALEKNVRVARERLSQNRSR